MNIPNLDPMWVSAFVTFILACITGWYAWQTYRMRKMRRESLKPNLSLIFPGLPRTEMLGSLRLRNSGGVARDIDTEINIKNPETNETSQMSIHIPSLIRDEEVKLIDLNVKHDIIGQNKTVRVEVNYENKYGESDEDTLEVDFGKNISPHHYPVAEGLKEIDYKLTDIKGCRQALRSKVNGRRRSRRTGRRTNRRFERC